jgi:tetratricopeptide (TPR) repeat protein
VEVLARVPGSPVRGALLAFLYAELDRDDEARHLFEGLATTGFEHLPWDVTRLRMHTWLATTAAHLGDAARGAVLYRLLALYAENIDETGGMVAGSVAHYLGLLATILGYFDEADAHFAAASSTHARIGAPTWLARTRLEWAGMLLTRRAAGDVERARELLRQALATARELGLRSVERRAVILLRSDCDV